MYACKFAAIFSNTSVLRSLTPVTVYCQTGLCPGPHWGQPYRLELRLTTMFM